MIAACLLATIWGPVALAADWPQWGGTDTRNMVSSETGLPESFVPGEKSPTTGEIDIATTKNVKWAVPLGGASYGNVTVANGRVFVGTDDATADKDPRFTRTKGGMLKCLDEATGKLLWQLVVPARKGLPKAAHLVNQHIGIASSPIVDGDRVFIVTNGADVLCLDVHGQAGGNRGPFVDEGQYMAGPTNPPVTLQPTDADIIWRFDPVTLGVLPHDSGCCSMLIHGDVLYLSTSNGADGTHLHIPAPDAPAFIALDKRTGRLLATEDVHLSSRLFHAQWCSPSLGKLGDKTLIFLGGGDGVCYAFEALETVPEQPVKLKTVWSYDCLPPHFRYRDGQPISYMDGDKLLRPRGPNNNDGLYVGPSDVLGTPVLVNNRIYVAVGRDPTDGRGKGMLHCIDATKTGDITQTGRIWTYDNLDRSISTATVAKGLVYLPDIAGKVHCLDADTGKVNWVYDSGGEFWGSVLVADGKLYFGNQKEFFVMAEGTVPKVLSQVRLGALVYSTPVVANGVLYVASHRYLWAVQQKN